MAGWWRSALGIGREPSPDQEAAITAEPTGRRTVDAGAGTGKTSTLALRALYLIESGHVRADQIVVVTFTKKAAAEIGTRIGDTIDRAIAAGAQMSERGQTVRCTTIHSLAADILREFALDFGFVNAPRAIGDGEAYGIFHTAFLALLEQKLAVETSAFPVAEVNLENLERDLGKLALRLKNHGISSADFEARARAQTDRFRAQQWGRLWTAGKVPGSQIDPKPKDAATVADIQREADREAANVRVVAAVFTEFDRRLYERGVATYGDLIGESTRLLAAHPEIVERLRQRWRYVLLDESQDTSTLQLAFIETLFGAPGDANAAGMMPVGDKRQAIYGFNGADEGIIARMTSGAASMHPLGINRRSPQEIVDAGHAVLSGANVLDPTAQKLTASAGSATMSCIRVQNFGKDGESIKEHVQTEAAAIAREIERLLGNASLPTQASDIAILVRRRTHAAAYVRALNLRGIGAALDRRSGLFAADEVRDAIAWLSLLVDLGDRQAAVRIFQSPLCGLSDAATIALAAADDWLERFLRDEITGCVDPDSDARLTRIRSMLVALLPSASLPLPLAMAHVLRAVPIAASYARIGETVGAQAIVNLRSFAALAGEFAGDQPDSRLLDFVADVKRRILYDDEPQEAELDLDGVRVMTIHQAKGLEWPYVFVACSTKGQYGTAGPSDSLIKYDLASGAFALKNDIDGRETFRWSCLGEEHDPDTGQRIIPQAGKTLAQREQSRVFYVALTRAMRRVYITAPAPDNRNGHATYIDSIRTWAEEMEPGVDLRFDVLADAVAGADPPRAPLRTAEIVGTLPAFPTVQLSLFRPRISFSSISTFQTCPRMARLRYRLQLPELREQQPRFVGVSRAEGPALDAARLGSLTHRALELWGKQRIAGEPGDLETAFADASLEFADVTESEIAESRARAARAARALAEYDVVAVEQKFEITIGETIVEGAIDLVARSADGTLWVIDYKTGRSGDEHYELQIALYRHAAMQRFEGADVKGAILRLSPSSAVLTTAEDLAFDDMASQIVSVGAFESDDAKVGAWCAGCAYNGSPCMAPLTAGVVA